MRLEEIWWKLRNACREAMLFYAHSESTEGMRTCGIKVGGE